MQATVCAWDSEPTPIRISAMAPPSMRGETRFKIVGAVMIIFAISNRFRTGSATWERSWGSARPVLLDACGRTGRRARVGKRPQTDLQHERVAEHGRRDACGVLVGLVGFKIPARRSRHHPVRGYLDRAGTQ